MLESSALRPEHAYIKTLDGWRAIAVSLVIGGHCVHFLEHNGSRPAHLVAALLNHAGYGVDIFFALSGFLICTLLIREKEKTGTVGLVRFYVRRIFRIIPPILLYLVCVVLLSMLAVLPHVGWLEIGGVLFFFRNYISGTWYTAHFWSLAVEEHFYLFAPFLICYLSRKRAARVALTLIALCIAIRVAEFSHLSGSGALIQFRTENRCDGLLWGSVLALLTQGKQFSEKTRSKFGSWIVALTVLGAVVLLTFLTSQPQRRTIVAAVMPILIGCTVFNPDSYVGKLLEWNPLRWLGRISYSLYIWQMLFLPESGTPLGRLQSFPLALVASLVCAMLSFYLVERPMIRVGHRVAGPAVNRLSRTFS